MNNRQAGRRRGRNNNNNRNQNNRGGGGIDRDNRIDNRARGNAAQMLDKYKKMAQDAQVNGDRVNAEYYHQFADHYFRVNADSQARREEQRLAREEARGEQRGQEGEDGNDRQNRPPRDRQQRDNRAQDDNRQDSGAKASSNNEDGAQVEVEKKPVRARRPRKPAAEISEANGESNGLDASALPPAISVSTSDDEVEVEKKPARKKRVAKPKVAETTEEGDAA